MANGKRSDAKSIEIAERTVKVLQLRGARLSYREIGKQLDISRHTVMTDLRRAFDMLHSETAEEAAKLRALLLERLEYLYEALASGIEAGDPKAIDTARKILMSAATIGGVITPRTVPAEQHTHYEMHFDTSVHEKNVIVYPEESDDDPA